jgi:hypothetical protein
MRQTGPLVALLLAGATAALTTEASNPFGFLLPDVVIDQTDLAGLRRGEPVIKLSNGDNDHVGVFAAIRIEASGDRLLEWAGAIEAMLKGRYVPEIGRFSSPARLEDLAGLTFDDPDLDEIRDCRPGDCGLKLSDGDIARLGSTRAVSNWENQAREELRRIVLERARAYQSGGDALTPPYHDDDEPVSPALSFGRLLNRLQLLPRELTCVATFVRDYPRRVDSHVVDSFLYWSKESLGSKPIIAITHLTLARFPEPWLLEAVVIGKQVFASHYKNGAMTLMAIVRADQARYLVYLQHAELDIFRGFWHDVVRMVLERRIIREAPRVLIDFRDRLETGGPRMTDRPAAMSAE